jgi:hypothetical protein
LVGGWCFNTCLQVACDVDKELHNHDNVQCTLVGLKGGLIKLISGTSVNKLGQLQQAEVSKQKDCHRGVIYIFTLPKNNLVMFDWASTHD